MSNYNCNICNKKYSCYQSYWYHNKKNHKIDNSNDNNNINNNNINNNNLNTDNKIYKCTYCNKIFKHRSNMYNHKNKICKKNMNLEKMNTILDNININNDTKNQIKEIINNNIVINNNIQNNNIKINNIIINTLGHEDINELNSKEKDDILNNNKEPISKMIEILNFNERLPHNHSFCITSLDSKYLSVYDKATNKINKEKKINLFRNLMDTTIIKIKQLFHSNREKYNDKIKEIIENHINEFINIKKIIIDDKYKRSLYSNINLISYNKKDLILNTWSKIKSNEIDDNTTWIDDL
jgi:hypothetical protein